VKLKVNVSSFSFTFLNLLMRGVLATSPAVLGNHCSPRWGGLCYSTLFIYLLVPSTWWWSHEQLKHVEENNNKWTYGVGVLFWWGLDPYWLTSTMGLCWPTKWVGNF